MSETNSYEGWAFVEVMGHSKYWGRISEMTVAGTAFIRLDVPACERQQTWTKLLSPSSIFSITPCTEEMARQGAATVGPSPIDHVHLPSRLRALPYEEEIDGDLSI